MPVRIARTQQITGFDEGGQRRDQIRVVWYSGTKHGPYEDLFDAATFDAGDVRRKLQQKADRIEQLDQQ